MNDMPKALTNSGSSRAVKAVATVCFLSIAMAIFLASNNPATGYELSIYESAPILVWVLLLISVVGGISLITYRAFSGGSNSRSLSLIIGPLALAHGAILLLPALRGYFLYASSDSLVHLGRGVDILTTARIDTQNFYPTIHILIAQLSQICNIPPSTVALFLPVLLSLGFAIVLICLLARTVLPKEGQILLAFGLSSGFLLNSLHVMVYSQVLAFFALLLVLLLRLDETVYRHPVGRITLVIVLVFIAFSHPATAVEVVFLVLGIELADALYRRITAQSPAWQISLNLPLISVIVFFMWISSFFIFGRTLELLPENTLEPFQGASVQALETALGSTGTPLGILLKVYGDSIVCLALAIVGMVLVSIKVLSGQDGLRSLWALTAVWLTATLIELLIFIATGRQTVGRFANLSLAVFVSPLLAGFGLYELLRRIPRPAAIVTSAILLLSVWVVGALSVYHSPWLLQPSWQITLQDVRGSEWFVEHKSDGVLFSGMGYNYGLPSAILGDNAVRAREEFFYSQWQMRISLEQVLPVGFGYDRFSTFGESFSEERYLVVAESIKLASAHPQLSTSGLTVIPLFVPGFRPTDFEKLTEDPTVRRLYSNGEVDIWLVDPRAE